jgi:uncharacterized repeat protein (TIGR04076 family)
MQRREFCGKAGGALAGLMAAPIAMELAGQKTPPPPKKPKYKLEVEIFEARQDTWCHKKGDKFQIPEDKGKICPWLLSSMHDFIVALKVGATLPWKYEGTPYEKIINVKGITTEYVRCPDPTANLVAKITRTEIN